MSKRLSNSRFIPPNPSPLFEMAAGMPPDTPLSVKLTGEVFLAIQIIPGRTRTPFENLAWAVLTDGIEGAIGKFKITVRRGAAPLLRQQDREWVASDSISYPHAFLNLCDIFGLDAGSIRRKVLGS